MMASVRTYCEEELTDLEWTRRAPDLEPGSFLRKEDGSGVIDPRGVALAFVKEGYFAQCDAIGLPREEPHWTSLALRRSQSLQFTNLKRFSRLGAPTAQKLGLVELCTVVSATYHRRILPEDNVTFSPRPSTHTPPEPETVLQDAAMAASALQPSDSTQPNATSRGASPAVASPDIAQVWLPDPVAQPQTPEAFAHPETPEAVPDTPAIDTDSDAGVSAQVHRRRGQFFVRLVLKQSGMKSYNKGALTTAIDFYVDSGTGEWLIPRSRYEEAQSRAWRRGNRFRMFWDAPETPGVGMWWHGVVRGRVQRDRFDPLRDSPWEALRVRWDSGGSETMVSMWEIQPEETAFYISELRATTSSREDHVVSDDEAEWQPDWRSGSDSEGDSDEQRRRRRRRQRQVVLPGEIETEQHLRDPARRQRRGGSSQPRTQGQSQAQLPASRSSASLEEQGGESARILPPPLLPLPQPPRDLSARPPLTMQRPSSRHLKMDWNSLFCGRCADGGELLECDGTCLRSFHLNCLTPSERPSPDDPPEAPWYCPDCRLGIGACAICKQTGVVGQHILKCKMGSCGYYFHNQCLNGLRDSGLLKIHREDPAVANGGNGERVFTCPAHFCHVCRMSGDAQRMVRCWRCPTAYHSRCQPSTTKRMSPKYVECGCCRGLSAPSLGTASVQMIAPVPTPRNQHEAAPSNRAVFDCGASEQPVERKRPRKPKKDGGNASRNVATKRPDTAGPSNAIRQPQPQQPPVAARPSTAVEPSSDAMQRPTRLAVLEAKIMEDAAVEEALGCTGRIVPLEGNQGSKDLVGKTVFTFGAQKKGGDFYVPSDRIKIHSQLVVHDGGRVTIGFCNAQARERYPITIIHAEGEPTTLTNMQSVPLRHQDVITIADACFIFERVGIEEAFAAR